MLLTEQRGPRVGLGVVDTPIKNLKTWTNNPSSLIPEVCKLWSVKEWLWAERVYA